MIRPEYLIDVGASNQRIKAKKNLTGDKVAQDEMWQ